MKINEHKKNKFLTKKKISALFQVRFIRDLLKFSRLNMINEFGKVFDQQIKRKKIINLQSKGKIKKAQTKNHKTYKANIFCRKKSF